MNAENLTLLSLDADSSLDPTIVGQKAAMLARARKAGLPVLDGFVVPVAASVPSISAGMKALEQANSGFARTTVTDSDFEPTLAADMVEAAGALGRRLVVRSSTVAEAHGGWAGAFASYAELVPEEVITGVKGCWASVFTPDALQRAQAAGLTPDTIRMAVLIQLEITPEFGGVAVRGSDTVTIAGVAGAPAAIVSGWERGEVVVVAADGRPDRPVKTLGRERVAAVAELTRRACATSDSGRIEWAEAGGRLWLLQAQPGPPPRPLDSLAAVELSAESVDSDSRMDPLELIRLVADEVAEREPLRRCGITKNEPPLYRKVSSLGKRYGGEPAAAGRGVGRIRLIRDATDAELVEPRQVVAAKYPLTNLAPLLWDAAGLVTIGGSQGAHLFEVAAWLGVPAVCGVDLEDATGRTLDALRYSTDFVVAVDGDAGAVTLLEVGN